MAAFYEKQKILQSGKPKTKAAVSKKLEWNAEKIDDYNERVFLNEIVVGEESPYLEDSYGIKAPNLYYEYSQEEIAEIKKCAEDVVYFANKYAHALTDQGVMKINLYDYQEKILKTYQNNRYVVFLASRQIGKTITSAIFIAWYLCFHVDRNVMILGNKGGTAAEIIDKVKTVYVNLPVFLKPGVTRNNINSMYFDNGCRVMSTTTTGTAAVGFTIHLLYADEFAHVPSGILADFYRSIYPTLTASSTSKFIITSTPNGLNKFWEIYDGAIKKNNEFVPIRVDWWEVPGRDEEWKASEIRNLGSQELFDQEYGNTFLSSDSLLLKRSSIDIMERIVSKYVNYPLGGLETLNLSEDAFTIDEKYRYTNFKNSTDYFVMSVDIAEGLGQNSSCVNIFKIELKSKSQIKRLSRIDKETDFFRLRQIAKFVSNTISVENLAHVINHLLYTVFNNNFVRIVIEMNYKGDVLVNEMKNHKNYNPYAMFKSKHAKNDKYSKIGIKLNVSNKGYFCENIRDKIDTRDVVITDYDTFEEFTNFGKEGKALNGSDDLAMTVVNLVAYLKSKTFTYTVDYILEDMPTDIKKFLVEINDTYKNDISRNDKYSYIASTYKEQK